MVAVLVLEALRCEALDPLAGINHVLRALRLEGADRSLSGEIVHGTDGTPGETRPNPQDAVGAPRRSTDAASGAAWENPGMRLDPFRLERDRRTATVIEVLRRRAQQRRARGQAAPPSEEIAEVDRQPPRTARKAPRSAPR